MLFRSGRTSPHDRIGGFAITADNAPQRDLPTFNAKPDETLPDWIGCIGSVNSMAATKNAPSPSKRIQQMLW